MTGYSKTLLSLIAAGFERREARYGMPMVGYKFRYLDLEASDVVNMFQQPVVSLGGILNTGRVIAHIEQQIPHDLDSPEAAMAWISYALRDDRKDLEPLPAWFLTGEQHWDLIPQVRRQRLYEKRPRCSIERDHARLMRAQLRKVLEQAGGRATVGVVFDGSVVAFRVGEDKVQAVATGQAWTQSCRLELAADALPTRFAHEPVEVSVFDGELRFANTHYRVSEV